MSLGELFNDIVVFAFRGDIGHLKKIIRDNEIVFTKKELVNCKVLEWDGYTTFTTPIMAVSDTYSSAKKYNQKHDFHRNVEGHEQCMRFLIKNGANLDEPLIGTNLNRKGKPEKQTYETTCRKFIAKRYPLALEYIEKLEEEYNPIVIKGVHCD